MPSVGMSCLYSSRAAAAATYLRTVTWIATTLHWWKQVNDDTCNENYIRLHCFCHFLSKIPKWLSAPTCVQPWFLNEAFEVSFEVKSRQGKGCHTWSVFLSSVPKAPWWAVGFHFTWENWLFRLRFDRSSKKYAKKRLDEWFLLISIDQPKTFPAWIRNNLGSDSLWCRSLCTEFEVEDCVLKQIKSNRSDKKKHFYKNTSKDEDDLWWKLLKKQRIWELLWALLRYIQIGSKLVIILNWCWQRFMVVE